MTVTPSVLAETICARVLASADELNRLDGVAGDGDLGVTMSNAAKAVLEIAPGLDDRPIHECLRELGTTIARRAPSTAGTLIATALLAMARVSPVVGEDVVGGTATRLADAMAAIEARGGAHPGEKTMLDALGPAVASLEDAADTAKLLPVALDSAAAAARRGAEETRTMRAQVGRAGWLADRSEGSPDAGAVLVAVLFEASRDAVERDTTL